MAAHANATCSTDLNAVPAHRRCATRSVLHVPKRKSAGPLQLVGTAASATRSAALDTGAVRLMAIANVKMGGSGTIALQHATRPWLAWRQQVAESGARAASMG